MSFERPITIKEAIDEIYANKYLLPAIQREFVWDTEQIERLFDSLMRDYPIGSFLFWKVEKEKSQDYKFYEFIREYHEKKTTHNPKASVSGDKEITAILDGQQRLTALYIGMKGTYAYKIPYKRWDNDAAFPERKLYLNLLKKSSNYDMDYDFKFLTTIEAEKNDERHYWFEVGNILKLIKEHEINKYLIQNHIMQMDEEKANFANETLFKLHSAIHKDEIINYFLERDEKLDKVLNIFIRVNSGGTVLSYSDLLLSIATAQWEEKDAREEITEFVDEINRIGDGFNFNKDFVLKTCLVLSDFSEIAFKVDNFNRANMLKIEENWEEISQAIRLAVRLVSTYGYNRDTLPSNNALIPIAYYILKKGLPNNFVEYSNYVDDRKAIHKWLAVSLLKRTFSGQPDNVLRPTRQIILENNSYFPIEKITEKFRGTNKTITFNEDDIENLFFYRYGQNNTYSTLALLYPTFDFKNKFHIDHIHPIGNFTEKKLRKMGMDEDDIEYYLDEYNYLANLQLLEGIPNIEKSDKDFKQWLYETYPNEQERREYMKKHYIPDVEFDLGNFKEFIEERTKLMSAQFKGLLTS